MGFTVIVCLSAAGPPLLSDVRPGEEQGGDVAVIGQLIDRLDQALSKLGSKPNSRRPGSDPAEC
jgi:hypothetical protein